MSALRVRLLAAPATQNRVPALTLTAAALTPGDTPVTSATIAPPLRTAAG
jgi:hypothetical protein